jgi:large subunit ribosomal protein L4
MKNVKVLNVTGEEIREIKLDESVFDVPFNSSLVHQALVMYRANQRQGTHSTKTRAEVAGGGKKPWRQKGLNRARAGSSRSPIWRHGGVTFGPKPRDYRKKMNKKMRLLALKNVLSEKVRQDKMIILEHLNDTLNSTSQFIGLLNNLNIKGKVLILTNGGQQTLVRSTRNIKSIYTYPVEQVNAGVLLSKNSLLIAEESIKTLENNLKKSLDVNANNEAVERN